MWTWVPKQEVSYEFDFYKTKHQTQSETEIV